MGLLESALFRPRTGYYADLAKMAAALPMLMVGAVVILLLAFAWAWRRRPAGSR